MTPITRRDFLNQSFALGVAASGASFALGQQIPPDRFVGFIPLSRPDSTPVNRLVGAGLDARLFTDLSTLSSDTLITPTGRFFVRTACPDTARIVSNWTIRIGGLVRTPSDISVSALTKRAEGLGPALLECSGNDDPNNFGLMSAAEWQGVRLAPLLNRIERSSKADRVRISGLDYERSVSTTSTPGASWIFTLDQLSEAFLATDMNRGLLPADHGAPVRLVVPGWYGCVCIKWVNAIEFVDDSAPPTSQMTEFAARTHQSGLPALARDFLPATIDCAAVPVRVERWSLNGRSVYRVIGVLWGGDKPTNALEIQFRADLPFVRVTECPLPKSTRTWSLWRHDWTPDAPGRYDLVLRIADSTVRTRRLEMGFYRRTLTIDTV